MARSLYSLITSTSVETGHCERPSRERERLYNANEVDIGARVSVRTVFHESEGRVYNCASVRIETSAPIYQRIRHCIFYLSNHQYLFNYSQNRLLTEIPELTSALYYRHVEFNFSSRPTADRISGFQFTLRVTFRIAISNAILI